MGTFTFLFSTIIIIITIIVICRFRFFLSLDGRYRPMQEPQVHSLHGDRCHCRAHIISFKFIAIYVPSAARQENVSATIDRTTRLCLPIQCAIASSRKVERAILYIIIMPTRDRPNGSILVISNPPNTRSAPRFIFVCLLLCSMK